MSPAVHWSSTGLVRFSSVASVWSKWTTIKWTFHSSTDRKRLSIKRVFVRDGDLSSLWCTSLVTEYRLLSARQDDPRKCRRSWHLHHRRAVLISPDGRCVLLRCSSFVSDPCLVESMGEFYAERHKSARCRFSQGVKWGEAVIKSLVRYSALTERIILIRLHKLCLMIENVCSLEITLVFSSLCGICDQLISPWSTTTRCNICWYSSTSAPIRSVLFACWLFWRGELVLAHVSQQRSNLMSTTMCADQQTTIYVNNRTSLSFNEWCRELRGQRKKTRKEKQWFDFDCHHQ